MARKRQHDARKPKKRRQRGGKFDIQRKIEKLGIEFHPFSLSKRKRYQYLGPGTFLKKQLAHGPILGRAISSSEKIRKNVLGIS